jgi:hypothetical protein
MRTLQTPILAAVLALACASASLARAADAVAVPAGPAAKPASTFFGRPNTSDPVASPDGMSLAILPLDNLAGAKAHAARQALRKPTTRHAPSAAAVASQPAGRTR